VDESHPFAYDGEFRRPHARLDRKAKGRVPVLRATCPRSRRLENAIDDRDGCWGAARAIRRWDLSWSRRHQPLAARARGRVLPPRADWRGALEHMKGRTSFTTRTSGRPCVGSTCGDTGPLDALGHYLESMPGRKHRPARAGRGCRSGSGPSTLRCPGLQGNGSDWPHRHH
jgi:hypothetical protein